MPRQFEFLQSQLPEFSAITVTETTTDEVLIQAVRQNYGLQTLPTPYEIVLFFRTTEFDKTAEGYWWLSPTPDKLSVGFGNIAPRLVLWVHLRHRASGQELIIFNTHIDHRCTHPMVDLCREKFTAFTARALSLIFMGDLNFNPADSNYDLLIGNGWCDSHAVTSSPDSATFLYNMPHLPSGRIDHILYRGAGLTPQAWARLLSPDPERRLADHDPVVVRFEMK